MNNKKVNIGIGIILCLAIVFLSVICMKQNDTIQRNKVENLKCAFYYMQEIIEDESKNNFKNWDSKSANLYILQERTTGDAEKMGDYEEISSLILEVSKIENPTIQEAMKLLDKATKMKVSWNTKKMNGVQKLKIKELPYGMWELLL